MIWSKSQHLMIKKAEREEILVNLLPLGFFIQIFALYIFTHIYICLTL